MGATAASEVSRTAARPTAPRPGAVRALLLALFAALLTVAAPAPAVAGPSEDIAALVNQERWAAGLLGLTRNSSLDAVASAWAQQMAADNRMYHNPNTPNQIPSGWRAWGENVAQGYRTGSSMHTAWMSSPGHRANVLGDFTDIGVAFLSAGGTTWGVQVFAKYPGRAGVPAPAPAPAPPPAPPPAPAAPAPPAPPLEAEPEEPADSPQQSDTAPTPTPTPTAAPTPSVTAVPSPPPTAAPSPTATLGAASPDASAGASGIPPADRTSGTWPIPMLWTAAGIAALAAAAVAAILLIRRARGPVRSVRGRRRLRP